MLLGGLWHGASWNFVVWGGLHGLYLSIHKAVLHVKGHVRPSRHPQFFVGLFKILVTFHLVCLTWVFFRAQDFTVSMEVLSRILRWQPGSGELPDLVVGERLLLLLGTLILVDVSQARRGDHAVMVSWHWIPRALGYAALILMTLTLGNLFDEAPFIYFQF